MQSSSSAANLFSVRFDFSSREPLPAEEFLRLRKEEVRHRNARLEHPFVRLLFDGRLTLEQLRGWALQDYALKRCPTWWNAGRLLNSPTLAVQRRVVRSLLEELGDEGHGHTDMYQRFLAGLGVAADEMEHAPLLPSTVLALDAFMAINSRRDVVESLASGSVAGEAINVEFSTGVVDANDRAYHLPKAALEWFYEHIEADKGHSSLGERLVLEFAVTKDIQNRVWDAVIRSKSIYWVFFDGVYQAYVLGNGTSHPHYKPGLDLPHHYPFSFL